MNKKTAIILSTAILLSAGIPIGIKIKNKKEKEEIENTLNNILIPNAEKELNELMKQNRQLRDSICYLEELLETYEKSTNINQFFPQLREILQLTQSVLSDWHKQYDSVQSEIAKHTNTDSIPDTLQSQLYFLEEEIIPNNIANSKRLDFLLETSVNQIETSMNYFLQAPEKLTALNTAIHAKNIQNNLHTIKQTINTLNNSANTVKSATLQKLKHEMGYITLKIDSINDNLFPASKISQQEKKLQQLKQSRQNVGIKTKEQIHKLVKLRHSRTADEMYHAKKHQK